MHFKMSSAICFNLNQSEILSSGIGLNQQPQVLKASMRRLLKIMMEHKGEKDGSVISFFLSVFCICGEKSNHFTRLRSVVCKNRLFT